MNVHSINTSDSWQPNLGATTRHLGCFKRVLNLMSDYTGVSLGSVLGPLISQCIHVLLGSLQRYGVKYDLYADDTQLYILLDPDN